MLRPQKSTIVRFQNQARRALFRSADLLAPNLAGRIARDIWFTVPPRLAPTPLPEGGHPFAVKSLGAVVRGHVWGDGPVVYLVHGWGGRGSQLASFVDPLVDGGFRVVMFDAPAHGDSDHGPAGRGRTHGVEFGKALALIAHSLGTISTYLTLRFGWLSTRRLVLVAPMIAAEPLFDQFQQALGFGDRTRRAFDRHLDEFVGIPMAEFDAGYQASYVDPVPTLLIHDRGDRQTPWADTARFVESVPDARLVTTDGLGHRRILKDPTVVREVTAFLRNADAREGVA
jgi:pimeloyl-ACP methyl ester carboxylesterase